LLSNHSALPIRAIFLPIVISSNALGCAPFLLTSYDWASTTRFEGRSSDTYGDDHRYNKRTYPSIYSVRWYILPLFLTPITPSSHHPA
jgi:hypothetical protein